jgi:P27 family predicted phage terminase small subunit
VAKGRPPDPSRERRGTGNRAAIGRAKASTARALPAPAAVLEAEPPDGLPAAVAPLWTVCVSEMAANRHLRAPDLILLKAYCEAISLHEEASAQIHRLGVLVSGPSGPMVNPLIRVQKDAAATMRQLADVLGLDPTARIRAGLQEVAGASLVLGIRDRLVGEIVKGSR